MKLTFLLAFVLTACATVSRRCADAGYVVGTEAFNQCTADLNARDAQAMQSAYRALSTPSPQVTNCITREVNGTYRTVCQ